MQRNVGQLAELSRQLKAKTPRLDAVRVANVGVRLLARQGVDADTLSRDVADFELRTTCVGGLGLAWGRGQARAHRGGGVLTQPQVAVPPLTRAGVCLRFDAVAVPEAQSLEEYLAAVDTRLTEQAIKARAADKHTRAYPPTRSL